MSKTILYVEDNEFNRKIVRQLLARTSYRLIEAVDGEALIELSNGRRLLPTTQSSRFPEDEQQCVLAARGEAELRQRNHGPGLDRLESLEDLHHLLRTSIMS